MKTWRLHYPHITGQDVSKQALAPVCRSGGATSRTGCALSSAPATAGSIRRPTPQATSSSRQRQAQPLHMTCCQNVVHTQRSAPQRKPCSYCTSAGRSQQVQQPAMRHDVGRAPASRLLLHRRTCSSPGRSPPHTAATAAQQAEARRLTLSETAKSSGRCGLMRTSSYCCA